MDFLMHIITIENHKRATDPHTPLQCHGLPVKPFKNTETIVISRREAMLRGFPVLHRHTNYLGLFSHFIKIAVIKWRGSRFDAETPSVKVEKHRDFLFYIRDLQTLGCTSSSKLSSSEEGGTVSPPTNRATVPSS